MIRQNLKMIQSKPIRTGRPRFENLIGLSLSVPCCGIIRVQVRWV
jgi:hypothetical protein